MATLRMTSPAAPARTGVWIGIAAITMSFAAYTSALMVRQGAAADWQHFRLPRILFLNTLMLLASSATLARGRRLILTAWGRAGQEPLPETPSPATGVVWLSATLGLGVLFLAGQVLAWRDLASQGLFLATNPSSAFFYVFTAVHALHLLGGIAALAYLVHRVNRPDGRQPDGALGAASLYWHFMDVLWLYLLLVLALRL